MTTPLILRDWPAPPAIPADVEGFLDLRVRDIIAIMQSQDATHYTMVDDAAEVTVAVCVGSQFSQLAATAQKLFTPRPPMSPKTAAALEMAYLGAGEMPPEDVAYYAAKTEPFEA